MKGTIRLESIEGIGSTIRCILPLALENTRTEEQKKEEIEAVCALEGCREKRPYGLKVAVAEDNHIAQRYIVSLLEYYGCKAVVAEDGRKLLELLEADDFDCIIMDKNMPGMDGIEATQQIRSRETDNNCRIPIVGLTASAIAGDREKLLEAEMDYYLSKPVKQKELLEILGAIADQRHKIKSAIIKSSEEVSDMYKRMIDHEVFLEEAKLFGVELLLRRLPSLSLYAIIM